MSAPQRKPNTTREYEYARDQKDEQFYCISYTNACPPHYHKQFEILYMAFGKKTVTINGNRYVLKRGDLAVSNPYEMHEYLPSIAKVCVVCIPQRYLESFEQTAGKQSFSANVLRRCAASRSAYRCMRRFKRFDKANDLSRTGLSYALMGAISDGIALTNQKPQDDLLTQTIMDYIQANFAQNISLADLASHCGYSKSYVSKAFNDLFNCNLNEYVNNIRLQAFIERQTTLGGSVSVNAAEVGFNSPRTFYAVFKKHYNMTPQQYISLKKD